MLGLFKNPDEDLLACAAVLSAELERTVLSAQPQPGQIALVEEKVATTVKTNKAQVRLLVA